MKRRPIARIGVSLLAMVASIGTVVALDATAAGATTISVGSSPSALGVDPTTDTIYVANYYSGTVSVIDGATNTVTATVTVGTWPQGVGVDPTTDTIYVANENSDNVSVIDGATNAVTATIAVGYYPRGVWVDPTTDTVYVANAGSHSVSVIDGATNAVTATVTVATNPIGVAVDPTTDTVYVVNHTTDNVSVIDGATNAVTATVTVSTGPRDVAVDPTTDTIYVVNTGSHSVSVIDGATNTVTATVTVGTSPTGVAVDPTTDTIYVPSMRNNNVSVIDGATNTVTATGHGGFTRPDAVAVDSATDTIYVANYGSNTVSVLSPPAPPTLTTSSPGNAAVTLAWTAPSTTGGAPITGYVVLRTGTKVATVVATTTTYKVTGLTNGTSYSFTVEAVNAIGDSTASNAKTATPEPTAPGQPTHVSATPGNGQATVTWTAASTNGSPITLYEVTSSPRASTCTSTTTSCTVTNLTNGTSYTFTVTATNAIGTGPASSPSNAVTPSGAPGRPANVSATAGNAAATVTWTAAPTNGSPITGYTVTSSPGGKTCTSSSTSCTVTGLTNGTSYTFTVTATNAIGTGPASTPSAAVTPTFPSATKPTLSSSRTGRLGLELTWTAPTLPTAPVTGYELQRTDVTIDTYGASTTSASLTLQPTETAVFAVAALEGSLVSPVSPAVTVSLAHVPPGPPTITSATAGGASSAADGPAAGGSGQLDGDTITVTWTAPTTDGGTPVTGYQIYRTGWYQTTLPATARSYHFADLPGGTRIDVMIVGENAAGAGPGGIKEVSMPPTVPSSPRTVVAGPHTHGAIVSWSAPTTDGGSPITKYTVTGVPATAEAHLPPNGGTCAAVVPTTSCVVTGLTNGIIYIFTVTATNAVGTSRASTPDVTRVVPAPPRPPLLPPPPAGFVGIAATPTAGGYWLVGADGGVFTFGDAQFYGSLPGIGVHVSDIVGMAATPDGKGYWLVGADGGVYAFGDAKFYGSLPGTGVHVDPALRITATPTGHGYWLVASTGQVYAFGSATPAAQPLTV